MKQRNSQRHAKLRAILKEARIEAGLTQRELAAKLKVDKNFVHFFEIGERMLDVLEFIKYTKALNLDPMETLAKIV